MFLILTICVSACGSPQENTSPPITIPEHIEFEDRMAIRARLTTIRSEARDEAAEAHDRYASRDEAVAFEARVAQLEEEKRNALKSEYMIDDAQLEAIVAEYLQNQGVRIRE